MMVRTLLLILTLIAAVSCQTRRDAPGLLLDHDVIPVGSRVEFWIYTDANGEEDKDDGWHKSNIHIAHLPRPMTGAEARIWARGVGDRDTGMEWTHFYILVTHPGPNGKTYRSAITAARVAGHEPSARLQSPF